MLGNFAVAAQPIADTRGAPYVLPVTHGQYALSMQGAAKLITDVYPSGTFAVNGQTAGLSAQRPSNFAAGTYTLSGQDVTFDYGFGIVVDSGNYTLTGQDFVFDTGFGVVWAKGTFTLTGQSVNTNISMNAVNGSFTVTGQDALKGVGEVFEVGTFTMTLRDAAITAQFNMSVDAGSVSLDTSGNDIKIRGFLSAYVPPEIWTEVA